jgi:hypothetical protein
MEISTSNWSQILFDAEDHDPSGIFASSTFTAPSTGIYQLNCHINIATGNETSGLAALAILVNGQFSTVKSKRGNQFSLAAGNNVGYSLASLFKLAAGDYAQVYCYQNSGGNLTIQHNDGASSCYFNGFYVAAS